MMPDDRQHKVLALYRKAAGTDSPAERDAFLAKARELDVDVPDAERARRRQEAADALEDALGAFFGAKPQAPIEPDDGLNARQRQRRASWRRYAARVATTPEFKARRAAYMAEYRRRKAASLG